MSQRKTKPEVDMMIWMHLAKLSNLAQKAEKDTRDQMQQSIDRIIAILSGEHKQEDEPESVKTLQELGEWFNQREA
jgi:hypothetical protein